MAELWSSIAMFAHGIGRRLYFSLATIFVDPFEVYERAIYPHIPADWQWPERLNMPVDAFPYALGGMLLLASFLTYHDLRLTERRRSEIKPQGYPAETTASVTSNNIAALMIVFGAGDRFERVERAGATLRRTVSIQVKNDSSRPLSMCRFQLARVTPDPPGYLGPWAIGGDNDNFHLGPFDSRSIDVACYDEMYPDGRKAEKIMICLPPGAFFAEAALALPISPPPVLTLRATSPDSRECEVHCRLLIDDAGHLRIESFE